jgi:hypothetical protein
VTFDSDELERKVAGERISVIPSMPSHGLVGRLAEYMNLSTYSSGDSSNIDKPRSGQLSSFFEACAYHGFIQLESNLAQIFMWIYPECV